MASLALTIKWLGHACFLITTMAGTNIVFDPFVAGIGYDTPNVKADVVFISHDHLDHNSPNSLKSVGQIVRPITDIETKTGTVTIEKGSTDGKESTKSKDVVQYTQVLTAHDPNGGKDRGKNTVYVIEVDGIRICHMGDIGHGLGPRDATAIGKVDVLMIPVGGVYTIDGPKARKIVRQIKPKYVIPMHYDTPALKKIRLDPVDGFLKGPKPVEHKDELRITKGTLPKETTVVVMKY